jgi:PAS domain S-box-containing protein
MEKAIDELRESNGHFRLMVDNMPALAWSCQPDGTIEFLNPRWFDYTGLLLEEALGWGWKVSIHPDDLAYHDRGISELSRNIGPKPLYLVMYSSPRLGIVCLA